MQDQGGLSGNIVEERVAIHNVGVARFDQCGVRVGGILSQPLLKCFVGLVSVDVEVQRGLWEVNEVYYRIPEELQSLSIIELSWKGKP